LRNEKITNKHYKEFLETGQMDFVTEEELKKILDNISIISNRKREARALCILLYYTGCRPAEAMYLCGRHIEKDGSQVAINFKKSFLVKRTKPRVIRLMYKLAAVKELYDYAKSLPPDMYLFYSFRSERRRIVKNNYGIKEYPDIASKVYNHLSRWTSCLDRGSINPYYFRHSRFSKQSAIGTTAQDIAHMKGGTLRSAEPYIHQSKDRAKKLAKSIY